MIVINLFGGPGAGKSTTAAGLFFMMKNAGMKVELVTEYAKDIVWAGRHKELDDQLYIFAKQHHRLHNLVGKVEFVITDSPLLLSSVYGAFMPASFHMLVRDLFLKYDNRSIVIERVKPYAEYGRNQSEFEAREIDKRVNQMIASTIPLNKTHHVPGDVHAPIKIINWLKETL
jgi:energy-coupling factor transporter ATP-binding protein EcfA2